MDNALFPGLNPSGGRGRGRPKGAKNKRSLDLAKFNDGVYGGSAAQQLASFCMVTSRELAQAGGDMMVARVRKAKRFVEVWRVEVGTTITVADAMGHLSAGLKELLPYTDQKMAPLDVGKKAADLAGPMIVLADAEGVRDGGLAGNGDLAAYAGDFSEIEENQPLSLPASSQVAQTKSHT